MRTATRHRPPRRVTAGLVAAATVLLASALPVQARIIAVPQEYRTIGAALSAASSGDIVFIDCGTYYERNLQVNQGVSLWSATLQPDCATIDAQGRGRLFVLTDCDTTTQIVGLTLRNGVATNSGGAIVCRNASPVISRCVIQGSTARRGGGIATSGGRGPVIRDCTIVGNQATLHGGGLLIANKGSASVVRCRFEDNLGLSGGGIAVTGSAVVTITDCTLAANKADASGGGLWSGAGTTQVRSCLLARNHGILGGGGMMGRAGTVAVVGSTVVDNRSDAPGGGLLVHDGTIILDRSLLAFNTGTAIKTVGSGHPQLATCNIFGHPEGDWTGSIARLGMMSDNFSDDPLFCQRAAGDYDLKPGSPCLPQRREGFERPRVGARGLGCK